MSSLGEITMADVYSEKRVQEIVDEVIDKNPTIKDLAFEVHRTQVLLEDNTSKVDTVLEILSDYLKTSQRVDGHETRIATLENKQSLLTSTVRAHSKQLKTTN